jgi:hypothetical protein
MLLYRLVGLTIKGDGELNSTVHGHLGIISAPGASHYIVISIQDMTICDGASDSGGGIDSAGDKSSEWTLENGTVSGNSASRGGNIKIHQAQTAPVLPDSALSKDGTIPDIPKKFRLLTNYPNPFNPETWIPYTLASDVDVVIGILVVSGQKTTFREMSPCVV